jgi:hypothetical protein
VGVNDGTIVAMVSDSAMEDDSCESESCVKAWESKSFCELKVIVAFETLPCCVIETAEVADQNLRRGDEPQEKSASILRREEASKN